MPENNPPRFFAITFDNQVVGNFGIVTKTNIYRKNVEIGFFVSEKFWGKGIATKAIRAAVPMLLKPLILSGYMLKYFRII